MTAPPDIKRPERREPAPAMEAKTCADSPSSIAAARSSLERPGISTATLEANGIRRVSEVEAERLTGATGGSGIWIPFHSLEGDGIREEGLAYGRFRYDSPPNERGKYHQRKGSDVHAYIPRGLSTFGSGGDLVLVEGEFKALSLVEAGFAAVGISGFYGFGTKDVQGHWRPVRELKQVLEVLKPARVFFLGDSDTATNFQFSDAATKLAKMLRRPVHLPRLPLAGPKGADDIRAELNGEFRQWFAQRLEEAVEVAAETPAEDIALALFEVAEEDFKSLAPLARSKYLRKATGLAASVRSRNPAASGRLAKIIAKAFDTAPADVRSAIKSETIRRAKESAKQGDWPEEFGPRWESVNVDDTGEIVDATPAERHWAHWTLSENRILFEPTEGGFYRYANDDGTWNPETPAAMQQAVSDKFLAEAKRFPWMDTKPTRRRLEAVVSHMQGIAERRGAFAGPRDFIHCANQVIEFRDGEPFGAEFSPDFFSRNALPVEFNPAARCPLFLEFLENALEPDDILVLQKYAGQCVLQTNLSQQFIILCGEGELGKTQASEIFAKLVGERNTTQLRTKLLNERFEIGRLFRKTLLTAPDVKGNFLETEAAATVKALCGGDFLDGERKNSNEQFVMRGRFNIIITTNERLRVRLSGDVKAWQRRLILVPFTGKPPKKRIPNFADYLFEREASGILNWAIAGAMALFRDIEQAGTIVLTPKQRARVDDLLAESRSLELFVRDEIGRGDGLPKARALEAYGDFCGARGWEAFPLHRQQREIPELVLKFHHQAVSNSLPHDGRPVQGWRNLELKRQ
jgi:P4 family phage/plasmid primase-like protien